MQWQTTRFQIELAQPKVMGIVNVTPDSFSDGGKNALASRASAHCEQLIEDGAHILDIGGESTRPGAAPVPVQEELARVLPVLRYALTLGVPVSIDTYKPQVMQAALDLGVDIVNDVWALRQGNAAQIVAQSRCGVCLMHMHGEPSSMQAQPMQGEPVAQVLSFLEQRVQHLRALRIESNRIVLDPGIGFGKTPAQNFELLAKQRQLLALDLPLLLGWSRKSSLAQIAPGEPHERVLASVVAAVLAVERGARVVRVHDVRETVQGLGVFAAISAVGSGAQRDCPE